MAIALVANAAAQGPTAVTDAVTSAIDTTGATLLVAIVIGNSSAIAPTDSKGNTWVQINNVSVTTGSAMYYVQNPTVGTGHTFTYSGARVAVGIAVCAFSGTDTGQNVDQQATGHSASGANVQPSGLVPSTNDQVVVTGATESMTGNIVIDSGFTRTDRLNFAGGQAYAIAMAYKIQTTAGYEQPLWSWDNNIGPSNAHIGTFKAAGGGGGGNPWYYYANQQLTREHHRRQSTRWERHRSGLIVPTYLKAA